MLGIDARVEDLKKALIDSINEANMPACLLDYVLTEILNNVRMKRLSEVQRQREEFRKEPDVGEVSDGSDLPCSN